MKKVTSIDQIVFEEPPKKRVVGRHPIWAERVKDMVKVIRDADRTDEWCVFRVGRESTMSACAVQLRQQFPELSFRVRQIDPETKDAAIYMLVPENSFLVTTR